MRLIHGECELVLPSIEADSVEACVTDPPYGLKFMGRKWDASVPTVAQWAEVFRVLKPGAHLLAFGGTRTYHRLVCNIEDAGFEIRDQLAWIFGSGFPKSLNLEEDHEGWGSALKPAQEPICLARKPIVGTIAGNMKAYGTGALNIEGCRVSIAEGEDAYARNCSGDRGHAGTRPIEGRGNTDMRPGGGNAASGRWPANVVHDGSEEVVALFPDEAGAAAPVTRRGSDKFGRSTYGAFAGNRDEQGSTFQGDSGSAARFFYCAKASREDREDGLAHIERRPLLWSSGTQSSGTFQAEGTDRSARNNHPTVKPTELMRWLCRLITPPGGTVLDPFMGSGSTGRGAFLEGFGFIGIERELQWMPIAEARIRAIAPLFAEISA